MTAKSEPRWKRLRRQRRERAAERRALMRGRRAALQWAARVRRGDDNWWGPHELKQLGSARAVVREVRTMRAAWENSKSRLRAVSLTCCLREFEPRHVDLGMSF